MVQRPLIAASARYLATFELPTEYGFALAIYGDIFFTSSMPFVVICMATRPSV